MVPLPSFLPEPAVSSLGEDAPATEGTGYTNWEEAQAHPPTQSCPFPAILVLRGEILGWKEAGVRNWSKSYGFT